MESQAIVKAQSCFELPTHQRRLRHLRSLAVRNLTCPGCRSKDVAKLQSYFTLHLDRKSPAFYASEKITGSLNPSWQSFDIRRFEKDLDTKSKSVNVKVWVGVEDRFMLLLDWQVNLTGLIFTSDKLQETVKYGGNTLIFGMFDKYFMAPTVSMEPVITDKKKEKSKKTAKQKENCRHSIFLQVDQSAVRSSYTSSSLSRIHTVLRAIKQNQATVNRVHQSIEDRLLSSQEKTLKMSTQEELLLRVSQLKNELRWQMSKLQAEKDESAKLLSTTEQRKKSLKEGLSVLEKEKEHFHEKMKSYHQSRESLIKESAQLWIRRKQLISELATYIYPISENKKQQLMITNVKLPDSEDFQGQDETMIAVSLGYTCHLTMMISHVLDIPLRFPMELRGSRSLIKDHIHTKLADKDREFPLYSKGKEKFQFNYGVFLLNKNISQLRFGCGLGTTDLRTTLQNLKTLLELRLGVKMENPSLRIMPGAIEKDRSIHELERTDGHSSIASGGRFSLPGSTDMQAFENILLESKRDQKKKTDNDSSNASLPDPLAVGVNQDCLNDDSEDIFRPMEDDTFFRVSSPAAERLGVFNDIDAIQEEFSSNQVDSDIKSETQNSKSKNQDNLETDFNSKPVSLSRKGTNEDSDIIESVSCSDIQNHKDTKEDPVDVKDIYVKDKKLEECDTFVNPENFKSVSINLLDDDNSDSLSDSGDIFQL